jgi:hypothetical protein
MSVTSRANHLADAAASTPQGSGGGGRAAVAPVADQGFSSSRIPIRLVVLPDRMFCVAVHVLSCAF